MPKSLVGSAGSFPTQTAPFAGEARTAGSVETPFQNAADRAEFLKERLLYLDPTKEGLRRFRSVASIAALQALTDRPDGTVIEVAGVGLYRFDASSSATELSPLVVKPTDISSGSGRWLVHGYGMLNAPYGIPTLDASGRVANARLAASGGGSKILGASVANGIVDVYTASAAAAMSTTSVAYVNVGSISVVFTLEIGDRVLIFGQAVGYQQDLTPAKHFTQWLVTKPDASTATVAASETERKPAALNEPESIAIGTYFTATTAGAHTFVFQQKSEAGSGGATVSIKNLNVIALHVRP